VRKIAIIGGGAAGMMAAAKAIETNSDCSVLLFEKNAYLGAKVLISGGGRCNVTTGIHDVRELLKNYPRGPKFLMSAMFRFPPEKVMAWFEEQGVRLKTEADLRVFPISDNGKDIVGALERAMRKGDVEIFCSTAVEEVARAKGLAHTEEGKFIVTTKDGRTFEVDAVVLTTGGNAYRHTGSTGDGYAFAQALGHTLTPLGPALNSLIVAEKWVKELAGVSFEKVRLTLADHERLGAFVFTHRGLSGPAVFALSSLAAHESISPQSPLPLTIDFFPDERFDSLDHRLVDLIQKNPHKSVLNLLDILLPKSLCGPVVLCAQLDSKLKAGSLTKEQRLRIVTLLKGLPLSVVGRSGGEEFVTAGGIDLAEMNTNTMESKISPGLYCAGELLDVDGFTGGFNLQASWATGALAGESAAGG